MDIKKLKQIIEDGNCPYDCLIFQCKKDNYFVAEQYIKQIAVIKHKDRVRSIADLSECERCRDIFFVADDDLHIYKCEELTVDNLSLWGEYGLFIITDKVSTDVADNLSEVIVKVPEVEEWCLKDLLFSCCKGADKSDLEIIFPLMKSNPYRVQQEIDRIALFPQSERKRVVKEFIDDGIYDDLCNLSIMDLAKAIVQKNITVLKGVMLYLDKMDVNGFALTSILYQQFRNVILVQLSKAKTTESTGLPSNQIYAISKQSIGYYSKGQLIEIFKLLTEVPNLVKLGKLPSEDMVNYIIIKILLIGGIKYD